MKKLALMKTLLVFFLMSALTLTGFSKEKEKTVASRWATTPLIIDGTFQDWEADILNFEEKLGVDYAFKNDAENLFILFIFKDPKFLSTIKDTGMTLWINIEGKKKKNYGILFTKKQVPSEVFISLVEKQKGPLSEEEKNNIRANPQYVLHNAKVIGKSGKSLQASDSGETQQAIFRTVREKQGTVYEFAIPIERKSEQGLGIGAEPGKVIKIAFEWGGITQAMKEARLKRQAEPSGTPMKPAVSSGSWSKGSSYGGRSPIGRQSPKKYTFWVNIQLAQNK